MPGWFIIVDNSLVFGAGVDSVFCCKKIFGYKLMNLMLKLVEPIAWLCSRKSSAAMAYKFVRGGGVFRNTCLFETPARQAHCLFAGGSGNISMHAV